MKDENKTKEQLINELGEIRQRISELETFEIERRKTEEAIQKSEDKYRTLIEECPVGIYYSDLNGTFLYGNEEAERIVGYKREELIGKNFLKLKLLDYKGISKAIKLLALNKLGKGTGPDEFTLYRKDGCISIVEICTRLITAGEKTLVLGMATDITERKQAEEALRESEERFRALVESTGDFI